MGSPPSLRSRRKRNEDMTPLTRVLFFVSAHRHATLASGILILMLVGLAVGSKVTLSTINTDDREFGDLEAFSETPTIALGDVSPAVAPLSTAPELSAWGEVVDASPARSASEGVQAANLRIPALSPNVAPAWLLGTIELDDGPAVSSPWNAGIRHAAGPILIPQ